MPGRFRRRSEAHFGAVAPAPGRTGSRWYNPSEMTVVAAKPRAEGRARPRLSPSGPVVLALDLGASRIRAAVVAADGRIVARDARPTPLAAGPDGVLGACVASLQAVRDELEPSARARLSAVGVAAPGPLDAATGTLLEPPNLGPAFRDLPLTAPLARALGLPVAVERDTNVAALAEGAFGAARGVEDYLYLTISSGIGGAVVAGGHLLRGVGGLAGELGHVSVALDGPSCGCGGRGHLEALASGLAIARAGREAIARGEAPGLAELLAAARAGGQATDAAPDARLVAAAELAGDTAAALIMDHARHAFAAAIVGFVDVFAPRLIVVGGSLAREQGERWLAPAREAIAREAFRTAAQRVRLEPAALGDDVGLVGAVPLLRIVRGREPRPAEPIPHERAKGPARAKSLEVAPR